ncbi:MAG: S1 RNA-binding domain-containing protein [Oscillospiraceae bacterium]|nr:S1 RNA-binding domain-containing protein [Oscillospiraceae bacterium]
MNSYLPEGKLLLTEYNQSYLSSPAGLQKAMDTGQILEAQAVRCDAAHNLLVDLNGVPGIIPREEAALGIEDGSTREIAILSRVGKLVSFTVESLDFSGQTPEVLLSRKRAQQMALRHLMKTLLPGMIIPAKVTHIEPFGVFVDIGCGVNSMISIENISVSRISHPNQRFAFGDDIYAAVLNADPATGRVMLTHRELLGTWAENAAQFFPGETVSGVVHGVKDYGIFVELTPNLSGLAEPGSGFEDGDHISVYIKSILPEQSKVKLLIIDKIMSPVRRPPLDYFLTGGRICHWIYRPARAGKPAVETGFY